MAGGGRGRWTGHVVLCSVCLHCDLWCLVVRSYMALPGSGFLWTSPSSSPVSSKHLEVHSNPGEQHFRCSDGKQNTELKLDHSKAHITYISHGAKSQELQSTWLKSWEGWMLWLWFLPNSKASPPLQRWLQDTDPSTACDNSLAKVPSLDWHTSCLASHLRQCHIITAFGQCLLFTHWGRTKQNIVKNKGPGDAGKHQLSLT